MELRDFKAVSEFIAKIYAFEGESEMQKLVQAVIQKWAGNEVKCKKILDSITGEKYGKWCTTINDMRN